MLRPAPGPIDPIDPIAPFHPSLPPRPRTSPTAWRAATGHTVTQITTISKIAAIAACVLLGPGDAGAASSASSTDPLALHHAAEPWREAVMEPVVARQADAIGRAMADRDEAAAGPRELADKRQAKPQRTQRRAARGRWPENGAEVYGRRPDAMQVAAELAAEHGLDVTWAQQELSRARYLPRVARLIAPARAGSAKDWGAYRDRFIEPSRIAAGRAFWQRHQRWLAAAETRFSVPAELIVGIIGVETFYGRITGDFRVLDALATLTLDYPKVPRDRTPFFRDELGQYLKLTWSQRLDPQTQRGSYAGAMGLGQFMPGSINRYAVDFDGDGRIDMIDSTADVIGSVANYIAAHGWTPGMPTHYAVRAPVDTTARATLLAPDIDPTFTAQRMTELGAELSAEGLAHAGPLALVELQNGDRAPSYVAGTSNFYTVTRYNHSSYYAMAVIGLGRAVAEARAAAGEDR